MNYNTDAIAEKRLLSDSWLKSSIYTDPFYNGIPHFCTQENIKKG